MNILKSNYNLDAIWNQRGRGIIHVHGLMRMGGGAPDVYKLRDHSIACHELTQLGLSEYTKE